MGEDRYYRWRQMTDDERRQILEERKCLGRPWHSPPHFPTTEAGPHDFHLSAACYNHNPMIGHSADRLESFSFDLLETLRTVTEQVFAWCVLPNHYHLLVRTLDLKGTSSALGRLHGRTSYRWNGEENTRGRQVFHRTADRAIRTDRHFLATVNYVHHNPVRHGYVERWIDWPWSSATEYLASVGHDEAERIWREYPLFDYGEGWDDASL